MQSAALFPADRAALSRPLRVAVIGAGVMGRRHARVLASRPERFELAAVMDLDEAAASDLAETYGARVAVREADALARAEAIVIATPIGAHAETVRRALASGRHVLVEKPIASNAREAQVLLELAAMSEGRVFVGHSERFNPVVRALARLVDAGDVRALELRRVGARRPGAGGDHGALVNLGVHDLDLAAYLTRSTLASFHAVGELAANGLEDRAHVIARTASGVAVHVLVDQRCVVAASPFAGRRRSIGLTTATHVWAGDLLAPSLVRTCRASGAREAIPLDTEEPLLAQALAFASAVRGGASGEIATGVEGARALLAAERAARQVHAGPVRPGENLRARPGC